MYKVFLWICALIHIFEKIIKNVMLATILLNEAKNIGDILFPRGSAIVLH